MCFHGQLYLHGSLSHVYIEAGSIESKDFRPGTKTSLSALMLCILKKNKSLQTAIDLRKRNANTFKDVTPLPDQDHIRNNVAKAKYQSKIDLTNTYKQILKTDKDVKKTVFATVFGTFYSHVMQIGDCNAPMTFIFHNYIGRFMHVYLDDIFMFSDSIEEHEEHLRLVFQKTE